MILSKKEIKQVINIDFLYNVQKYSNVGVVYEQNNKMKVLKFNTDDLDDIYYCPVEFNSAKDMLTYLREVNSDNAYDFNLNSVSKLLISEIYANKLITEDDVI